MVAWRCTASRADSAEVGTKVGTDFDRYSVGVLMAFSRSFDGVSSVSTSVMRPSVTAGDFPRYCHPVTGVASSVSHDRPARLKPCRAFSPSFSFLRRVVVLPKSR